MKDTYFSKNYVADGTNNTILDLHYAFYREFKEEMASKAEKDIMTKTSVISEQFTKNMSSADKKLFNQYDDLHGDWNWLMSQEAFVAGFKIATRLFIESAK